MNRALFAVTAVLITACAKQSVQPNVPAALSGLTHSFMSVKDSEAERFLIDQMIRGHGLSAKEASKCRNERPAKVAHLCLLAWARFGDPSPELTETLKVSFVESRMLSLALLLAPGAAASLDLDRLQKLVANLETFPSWIRAKALEAWFSGKDSLSLAEQDHLRDQLDALKDDFPLTQKIKFKLARKLLPGTFAAWHAKYCSPLLTGVTKVRCWRHLSAVEPDVLELRSLPPAGIEWKLFERAMPYRAVLFRERFFQEVP